MKITLNYSNPYETYFVRAFAFPSVGKFLASFFYKKVTNFYTKILLEFTGFQHYIDELNKEEANYFLKKFNQFIKISLILEENDGFLSSNTKLRELQKLIVEINKIVRQNIELLEDKIYSNFAYELSTNYFENDWNNPENDHWDKY